MSAGARAARAVRRPRPDAMGDEAAAEMCSICAEAAYPPGDARAGDEAATVLECGHVFHVACALQWFRYENTTCPNCRSDATCHVWSQVDAAARIRAMRRRRARLPTAIQRSLAQLDACTSRAAAMRRERRELRAAQKATFARDGSLRARIRAMDRRARLLRHALGGATAAGVPRLRYHGADDESAGEEYDDALDDDAVSV